jgi:hypothetical protein
MHLNNFHILQIHMLQKRDWMLIEILENSPKRLDTHFDVL